MMKSIAFCGLVTLVLFVSFSSQAQNFAQDSETSTSDAVYQSDIAGDSANLLHQASYQTNRFGGGLCKSFIDPIRREPGYLCTSSGKQFFGFNRTQDCSDFCP